jgi:hypothetical protein
MTSPENLGHQFIGLRHPDYTFHLYDNVGVTNAEGYQGHGHEVGVWHEPTQKEVGRLSWWDDSHYQLKTPPAHVVEEYVHPDHPGVLNAMYKYAENRSNRSKRSVLKNIATFPQRKTD